VRERALAQGKDPGIPINSRKGKGRRKNSERGRSPGLQEKEKAQREFQWYAIVGQPVVHHG